MRKMWKGKGEIVYERILVHNVFDDVHGIYDADIYDSIRIVSISIGRCDI